MRYHDSKLVTGFCPKLEEEMTVEIRVIKDSDNPSFENISGIIPSSKVCQECSYLTVKGCPATNQED